MPDTIKIASTCAAVSGVYVRQYIEEIFLDCRMTRWPRILTVLKARIALTFGHKFPFCSISRNKNTYVKDLKPCTEVRGYPILQSICFVF